MTNPNANVSASSPDIVLLEEEITALQAEQRRIQERIRALRQEEVEDAGVCHAGEIFRLQQENLRLETEILLRCNKIRLLNSGWA
jgi:hypothetical protein